MHAMKLPRETKWFAPEPMWRGGAVERMRPAILRFDTDEFMEELMAVLDREPGSLLEWEVQPENWRAPLPRPPAIDRLALPVEPVRVRLPREFPALPATANASSNAVESTAPLKLYQAAHQRHYVVMGSLIELSHGTRDRCVDSARGESVSFVLRRLVANKTDPGPPTDSDDWDELAYVRTADGYRWRKLDGDTRERPSRGEEQNPLFPVTFDAGEVRRLYGRVLPHLDGARRRLYGGVVPVAKREAYMAAPTETPSSLPQAIEHMRDPRLVRLRSEVIEPWKELLSQVEQHANRKGQWSPTAAKARPVIVDRLDGTPPTTPDFVDLDEDMLARVQTASWYVANDMLAYFYEHLRPVYDAIENSSAGQPIADWLGSIQMASTNASPVWFPSNAAWSGSLREFLAALLPIVDMAGDPARNALETVAEPLSAASAGRWPNVYYLLADPSLSTVTNARPGGRVNAEYIDALEQKVANVFATQPPLPPGRDPGTVLPTELDAKETWFQVRFLFEDPNCEPFFESILSAPSAPFKMAAFFDPDAPARPVRISLPMDISPAGLRKYTKNASFVISDMLCSKMKQMRKLTLGDLVLSVLPWPFHKDLPDPAEPAGCGAPDNNIGMLCSLSIPIVTICALLLLFVIVLILDYFFRWIPYLLVCFPIPGLKGKDP